MPTKPLEKFRRKLDSQRESDRSLADEKIQKIISLAIVLALLVATPVTSASALRKLFMTNSFLL